MMKKQTSFTYLFLSACLILSISACKKEERKEKSNPSTNIERQLVLQQTAENAILLSFQALAEKTERFLQATDSFKSNPTTVNLIHLQQEWKVAVSQWGYVEAYNIGQIKESYLYNQTYAWPAQLFFIESSIHGKDSLDVDYIKSRGASSKGFAGVEYLLFKNSNAAVLDSFTISNFAARRMDYLLACNAVINQNAKALKEQWINYSAFTTDEGNGIYNPFNQLINEIITLNEKVLHTKIGKPMGEMNNQSADSTLLEAYRGSSSLALIEANLNGLENCIFSNDSIISGHSIADYSNQLAGNEILSTKIKVQFNQTRLALKSINPPLKTAIYKERTAVDKAFEEVKSLLVLLKVDLASQLSITLTINDNDGD